jgi:hypothetical protein
LPVYGKPEGKLNQGDLLRNVPFLMRRGGDLSRQEANGLITSNSCDYDKFVELRAKLDRNQRLAWPLSVAPLSGLEILSSAAAGDARAGRHRRFFYVPRESSLQEQIADMWHEQPIPIVILERLDRVASLSDESLFKLWAYTFVRRTRLDPADVFKGGQLSGA